MRFQIKKAKPRIQQYSLARSTTFGLLVSVVVAIGSFGFNVLVARNLPIGAFASFVAIMTFINIVGIMLSGFQVSAARVISQGRATVRTEGIDKFTRSLLIVTCGLAVAVVLTSLFWNSFFGLSPTLVLALAVVFPSTGLIVVVNGRLAGLGRFIEQSVFSLALVTVNLVLQITIISLWGLELERVIWTQLVTNLILASLLITLTSKDASISEFALSAKGIQTLLIVAGFGFISSFDILVAPFVLDDVGRGYYSAASGLAKYFLLFLTMINAAIFTAINRVRARGQKTSRIFILSGIAFLSSSSLFAVLVCIFGPPVVLAIYGEHYRDAASFLPIIALATIPMVFVSWIIQFIYLNINWFISVTTVVVILILCFCALGFSRTSESLAIYFGLAGCVLLFLFACYLGIRRLRFISARKQTLADEESR